MAIPGEAAGEDPVAAAVRNLHAESPSPGSPRMMSCQTCCGVKPPHTCRVYSPALSRLLRRIAELFSNSWFAENAYNSV
ncbi:MAG: hypothetical protein ROW48_06915 [Bellilinea sp.]